MLHLADDFTKCREVATQYACLVHQPQSVGDAIGAFENIDETCSIGWFTAKGRVDVAARFEQCVPCF